MNENSKTYLGCAFWFLVAVLIFAGWGWYLSYYEKKKQETYIEKKRNDSIRKAFIADSLAHDPHYQDSIRKARAELKKWEEEWNAVKAIEFVGYMIDGDSVYHTAFHPVKSINEIPCGFTTSDLNKLRFVTHKEKEERNLEWCDECRSMDAETLIDDGDYIHVDDISDYIWDNKERFEYIFE